MTNDNIFPSNGYYDTATYPDAYAQMSTASIDPLAGLKAPTPAREVTVPVTYDDVKDSVEQAVTEITGGSYARVSDHSHVTTEALPKVVQCYECEGFAFDGTLTAFEVEGEGSQPFCRECVAKIEQRSWPNPVTSPSPTTDWAKIGSVTDYKFQIPGQWYTTSAAGDNHSHHLMTMPFTASLNDVSLN